MKKKKKINEKKNEKNYPTRSRGSPTLGQVTLAFGPGFPTLGQGPGFPTLGQVTLAFGPGFPTLCQGPGFPTLGQVTLQNKNKNKQKKIKKHQQKKGLKTMS